MASLAVARSLDSVSRRRTLIGSIEKCSTPRRRRPTNTSMTIKGELHQLVDELDQDSAEEALAYLQTLRGRNVPREASIDDVAGIEAEETAALGAWEDEGGAQAEHAVDERTADVVTHDRREDLHDLVDGLDEDSAVKALAHLRSLPRPRR